jgi:hypothetical protein
MLSRNFNTPWWVGLEWKLFRVLEHMDSIAPLMGGKKSRPRKFQDLEKSVSDVVLVVVYQVTLVPEANSERENVG